MFNLHDCKPAGFGNYAVPPRPRGAYRVLAQLQDAISAPRRLYASAWADCLGIIEKNDNLMPIDLNKIFYAVNNGVLYVPDGDFYDGHGLSMSGTALGADIFFAARGNPLFYAWQCFINLGSGSPIVMCLAKVTSTVWTWYDLRDMSSVVYPAQFSWAGKAYGWMLLNKAGGVYGDPWLNPI